MYYNVFNRGLKGAGMALAGIGIFGCVIYPMGYIPHSLYFISEQKPTVVWGILIGLVVVGGVLAYFGMKSEKAEKEKAEKGNQ